MAHSFPSSAAVPDESAPSAIRHLRPRSELALENFLTFYASRKVSTDEWNGRSVIGILELLQLWVQHGDAVVLFETYESYLESVGELVAAFGGTFADALRPSQMDAEPRDVLAAILYERESQPCLPRLHPAIRRETFDSARRLRTLRSLVN